MAAPAATVLRDGTTRVIPDPEVVPGDIALLEAGGIVPADIRLLDAARLRVEEATLTGESIPVEKGTEPLPDATLTLGDRTNMAYKGTTVTYGRGSGVVVATGMATEFGTIAAQLDTAKQAKTPLQRRLGHFGRRLAIAALLICGVVFLTGVWRGEPALLMFLTAVSLAVAAIPEALPAVVTVSLALGAREMVRKKALVRKLPAVETLGSVTYICSDKTGTLTMNRMRAEEFYCDGAAVPVPRSEGPWEHFLRAMALGNDVTPTADGAGLGDPTEVALFAAARDAGMPKGMVEKDYPRVAEIPFDSDRKCMTTMHRHPRGGFVSFTKGAPEVILAKSTSVLTACGPVALPVDELAKIGERMAADGLRVLALAMRRWPFLPPSVTPASVEQNLVTLGLIGLMDPPRPEAREAVEMCRAAGIVPVMITGDHPITARAIAQRVGILEAGDEILSGADLTRLSTEGLAARVDRVRVYARVAAEQKLHIVRALQEHGEIVAMTGDGVNDAPALKQADIGVAMGITGTDVSKEASSMILLDDNFATIVRAVRGGRKIYDNLRRFIKYVVTTNSAEVWLIFLSPFFGLPIPLLPIQILWINLVSDGLPGLALAAEPEEKHVMRRRPRPPHESVFAQGLGIHVIWVGMLMGAISIATEAWYTHVRSASWQTMVFTVLCFSQLAHVLAVRSERESLFTQGLFSNQPLLGSVILTIGLQLAVVYAPVLNRVFKTEPLSLFELAVAVASASVIFWAVEVEKWVKRRNALLTHERSVRRRFGALAGDGHGAD
jgi:P-type Ca2+ transporter type 2C